MAKSKDKPGREPMDEKTLLGLLKAEESDATSFYTSELAEDQENAMERYLAKPYGDEVEDRSKVVTHDVADTIDWILPDMMRAFAASDELVGLEPAAPEDEEHVENAAEYLHHIYFNDNDGDRITHDLAFDGLLQRVGVVEIEWQTPQPKPPQMLQGVTPDQLSKYTDDDEYEILGQEEREERTEEGPARVFDLEVKHTPKMGKVIVEGFPAEEFLISRRAKNIDDDYCARRQEVYLDELWREYPDKKDELTVANINASDADIDLESDARRDSRFDDEPEDTFRVGSQHEGRTKVLLFKEHIRVDYDGDGVVELRFVKRVGNLILENEPASYCRFEGWSPIPIAHKYVGRSLSDRVIDIQRIRTVTSRSALDNLEMSIRPRGVANTLMMDEDAIDALLDHEIGAIIPAKGPAGDAVNWEVVPDMTPSAFRMLEYWDQQSEQRTGISRHSQGLNPDALNKTASGIALLQNASSMRKEFVTRQFGACLGRVFQKILKCVCAYQDQSRMVKIKRKWTPFDPRRWSDEMAVKVTEGQGVASRETQLGNLNAILERQELILQTAGPSNPIVTIAEYRNALARSIEIMGYRDPSRFVKEIPEDYEPPEPEPQQDPKVIEAQAKAQESQVKLQMSGEEAQAKLALSEQVTQAEQARKDRELEADIERKDRQLVAEYNLKVEQMQAEIALRREQLAQEASLGGTSGITETRMGGDAG